LEEHCLLHWCHLGPSLSFQDLGFCLPNWCLEQDHLIAQVNSEVVKGIIGLPFTKQHLQWNQILCHTSSALIYPKVW
jgi:hypothetical protein